MSKIILNGMKFFGYHGCHKEEQKIGNNYIVDVLLETNLEKAAHSDSLHDTIDYVKVHSLVEKEIKITSKLLENVAQRIIDTIATHFPEVYSINVKVAKLNPPVGGEVEKVYVEIDKDLRK